MRTAPSQCRGPNGAIQKGRPRITRMVADGNSHDSLDAPVSWNPFFPTALCVVDSFDFRVDRCWSPASGPDRLPCSSIDLPEKVGNIGRASAADG